MSYLDLNTCPFCGGKASHEEDYDKGSGDGYVLPFNRHCVRCKQCGAQSYAIRQKPLCEFSNHTVSDYRGNPILQARIQDEYEKYIEMLKQDVTKLWNQRRP
jgi:ribosomal protein L37E